ENRMDELTSGVVLVGPCPVERAHAGPPAADVVGGVKAGMDRAVGPMVDQAPELAGGVVLVGGEAALAQVLAPEPASVVVAVANDQVAGAVGQELEPASIVVRIVHREA